MSTHQLVTFALLAFALIVVPGPSVLFVIGRAVTVGRRAALATVAGNAAGVYLQVVAVALGLGFVLARSELVFSAVKLLGAAYLVWLGIQAIRNRRALAEALSADVSPTRGWVALRDGFVVGASNPKATVFFAAVLPQFVEPAAGWVPGQMLLLGLVFIAIALLSDSTWALVAGTARRWLGRSRARQKALGSIGGIVMIGLALELALRGRR
jgi:threonine/homoserine/homoserine lactone efflux protein